jgi:hypothetical protein
LSVYQLTLNPGEGVSLPPFAPAPRLLDRELGIAAEPDDALLAETEDDALDETLDDGRRDLLGEMEIAARLMITGGDAREDARLSRSDRLLIRKAILGAARTVRAEGRAQALTEDVVAALRALGQDESVREGARERAAISISPRRSRRPSSRVSSSASSSVSAKSASSGSAAIPSSRSRSRGAGAKGGRLTPSPGFKVSWCTESPWAARCRASSVKELPTSMMKTRGRWIAMAWRRRYTRSADFPEPVGPKIRRWAFFFRSWRCRGSKVSGSPPRLKKVKPGRPVPRARP